MRKSIYTVVAILVFSLFGCMSESERTTPRIAIILAEKNFNDPEYTISLQSFEELGFEIETATISGNDAVGMENTVVSSNLKIKELESKRYDALFLVGGFGAESLLGNEDLINLINDFNDSDKIIGAQSITPVVVAQAGLLNDIEAACYSSYSSLLEEAGARYSGELVTIIDNLVTGMAGTHTNIAVFTDAFLNIFNNEFKREHSSESVTTSIDSESSNILFNDDKTSFSAIWNGLKRTGAIFFPSDIENRKELSIVLTMHGSGGRGSDMQNFGFNNIADKLGFIMIYPDGYRGYWESAPGRTMGADDVGFLTNLIEEIMENYNVDPNRIYATGFSMGGFMSYRLAQDRPGLFSAIAPVGGLMIRGGDMNKAAPLSLLHIHAQDDSIVSPKGASYAYSVRSSMELWKEKNGTDIHYLTIEDEQKKTDSWINNQTGLENTLIIYKQGGHGWFFDVTPIVMDFFYNHPARNNRISFYHLPSNRILKPSTIIQLQAAIEIEEDIKQIDFFADQQLIGTADKSPWSVEWETPEQGFFQLSISAELKDGEIIESTDYPSFWISEENLAKESAVTVSSLEIPVLTGANAVDGLLNTRWSSGTTDHEWLEIDLGSEKNVNGVSFLWEAACARQYNIKTSLDGENWDTALTILDSNGGSEYLPFKERKARFVRFEGIERATIYGYSFWEMMVHGQR